MKRNGKFYVIVILPVNVNGITEMMASLANLRTLG